ncbi:10380_t:CDS:2, partial [Dentiscutata heterogama]
IHDGSSAPTSLLSLLLLHIVLTISYSQFSCSQLYVHVTKNERESKVRANAMPALLSEPADFNNKVGGPEFEGWSGYQAVKPNFNNKVRGPEFEDWNGYQSYQTQ